MKFFATRYAFKSIMRRKSKNLAGILAIALGVTLFAGVQIATNGMEQAIASEWYSGVGDTDLSIIDLTGGYLPNSIVDLLENSNDPAFDQVLTVAPVIQYYDIPVYAEGQFSRETRFYAIETGQAGYQDFLDLDGNAIDLESALSSSNSLNPVIISSTMAKQMDIKVGQLIQSVLPNGDASSVSVEYSVTAIFDDTKARGIEGTFGEPIPKMYTHLSVAQSALVPELSGHVNRINLVFSGVDKKLEDLDIDSQYFEGKEVLVKAVDVVEDLLLTNYPTLDIWSERVEAANGIKDEVSGFSGVLNIFVFLLNATALLLIINIQSLSFQDRRYQTAVLRSMGSTKSSILRVFLVESTFIGFLGSLVGIFFGYFYGDFILTTVSEIFEIQEVGMSLDAGSIIGSILMGIILSVSTALIPAFRSAGLPIASELRGLEPPKSEKQGKKTLMVGFVMLLGGLTFAQNVGEFWTKEGWATFEDQVSYLLAFGLTLAGLGMLLTLVLPRRLAMNISGMSIWGLALFTMFVSIDWVKSGNANNWFTIVLLYLVIGSSMLVINNFDGIMRTLNSTFMKVPRARPISQVTSTQLIGKKTRATLVLTIFTLILVLNIFLISAAETMRNNYTGQFEWRSYGNDIVVNTEAVPVASADVAARIGQIDGVTNVISFRSALVPITFESSWSGTTETWFVRVVEITSEALNPDNDWTSERAFPVSMDWVMPEYDFKQGMSQAKHLALSITMLEEIFNDKTRELDGNVEHMVVGSTYLDFGQSLSMESVSGEPIYSYYAGAAFSFLGDWDGMYGALLVGTAVSAQIPEFQSLAGPNLFMVETTNGFADREANLLVSQEIQSEINNLADPSSLSSQYGALIGATTRIIEEEISYFWAREASVWDFLSTFAQFGLIIGGAGLAVIAVRSVAERTREIGMMRAIGFSRSSVVWSIVYEMLVIGILGVISGLINGILLVEMFTGEVMGIEANYPLGSLTLFSGIILGMSLLAAVLPSLRATKIAPSQALRYTG